MATGETGKILIRGPQVMSGYQNNPEATAAIIDKDGFFDTGAFGLLRLSGVLWGMRAGMVIPVCYLVALQLRDKPTNCMRRLRVRNLNFLWQCFELMGAISLCLEDKLEG